MQAARFRSPGGGFARLLAVADLTVKTNFRSARPATLGRVTTQARSGDVYRGSPRGESCREEPSTRVFRPVEPYGQGGQKMLRNSSGAPPPEDRMRSGLKGLGHGQHHGRLSARSLPSGFGTGSRGQDAGVRALEIADRARVQLRARFLAPPPAISRPVLRLETA